MRPINRGSSPTNGEDKKKFNSYRDASTDLVTRLGAYCSYCEQPLSEPAVEHKLPKSVYRQHELDWNNFLLSCRSCNSIKGHKRGQSNEMPNPDTFLKTYYWPDHDNTAHLFEYKKGGVVTVNSNLSGAERDQAARTLELTGLNRYPSSPNNPPSWTNRPKEKFKRWIKRITAWKAAEEALQDLQVNDCPQVRKLIVKDAKGTGFFSVWMTVFRDDSDMLKRFIDAFPGTRKEYFDDRGRPLPIINFEHQPSTDSSISEALVESLTTESEENSSEIKVEITPTEPKAQQPDSTLQEQEESSFEQPETSPIQSEEISSEIEAKVTSTEPEAQQPDSTLQEQEESSFEQPEISPIQPEPQPPKSDRTPRPPQTSPIPKQPPQSSEKERYREEKPLFNPSLRETPIHEPADVIPSKQQESLLNWLKRTGRLIARDTLEPVEGYGREEEEISELIVDDTSDDYDDNDEEME